MNSPLSIAFFISPHGFGHAARASAVMAALEDLTRDLSLHLYTTVPDWFFRDYVPSFEYSEEVVDIGVVQATPLVEDLSATVEKLDDFFPISPEKVENLASEMTEKSIDLIICDISPLGIEVAQKAQIPSVLVENFLWDWIYEGYAQEEPRLSKHSQYLKEIFSRADYHIQCRPFCLPAAADLVVAPVARPLRLTSREVRARLELEEDREMVLITMSGDFDRAHFKEALSLHRDKYFLIPGGASKVEREGHILRLPRQLSLYHPDLVAASRAVLGKAGYSTLAEVYQGGVPFGYVLREKSLEMPALEAFIKAEMEGIEIDGKGFFSGQWHHQLEYLLDLPLRERKGPRGAEEIARFITSIQKG